jgi:hypothetical protein
MRAPMAPPAECHEVLRVVRPALSQRHHVMDLEPLARPAARAGAVTGARRGPHLRPVPPPDLPALAVGRARGLVAAGAHRSPREGATAKARARDAGHIQPSTLTDSRGWSARSTAIVSAITASILSARFALSMRQPRVRVTEERDGDR